MITKKQFQYLFIFVSLLSASAPLLSMERPPSNPFNIFKKTKKGNHSNSAQDTKSSHISSGKEQESVKLETLSDSQRFQTLKKAVIKNNIPTIRSFIEWSCNDFDLCWLNPILDDAIFKKNHNLLKEFFMLLNLLKDERENKGFSITTGELHELFRVSKNFSIFQSFLNLNNKKIMRLFVQQLRQFSQEYYQEMLKALSITPETLPKKWRFILPKE